MEDGDVVPNRAKLPLLQPSHCQMATLVHQVSDSLSEISYTDK